MDISIVVVSLNTRELLLGCLTSIFDTIKGISFEVWVVDNNSTDNTSEIAQELGAIVVLEKKQGYGAAYKTGLRKAVGDIIVTMDGDANYPRNFIPVLLDIMFDEDIDFTGDVAIGMMREESGLEEAVSSRRYLQKEDDFFKTIQGRYKIAAFKSLLRKLVFKHGRFVLLPCSPKKSGKTCRVKAISEVHPVDTGQQSRHAVGIIDDL